MNRDYTLYLKDILKSIEQIESFVEDVSFNKFEQDDKTNSAVIRKLEVIGEATKNVPSEIQEEYEDIPWRDMAKMRDKIIHFYFGVDYEIVWNVIKERLPQLKIRIKELIEDL